MVKSDIIFVCGKCSAYNLYGPCLLAVVAIIDALLRFSNVFLVTEQFGGKKGKMKIDMEVVQVSHQQLMLLLAAVYLPQYKT